MEKIFQDYLDNFYLSISGRWCMIQKDVKELLLKSTPPATLDSSLPGMPSIKVNMFELSIKLPTAPTSNDSSLNNYIKTQARLLIIGCYEELKEDNDWEKIKKLPIMEVFKHIRNAAAHNNHFLVKNLEGLPVQWRNKIINLDTNGKELFSEWMAFGDIEYFFNDINEEIRFK